MKKYLALMPLLLFGCELIIDIDVPFDGPQLTINSVFHPDSVWSASVSLNRHILNDSTTDYVENAQVVVYKDGVPIETLTHKGNGVYRSLTGKPLPGSKYEIKATAESYGTATAQSHSPLPATIIDVTTEDLSNEYGSNIHIRFQDDADVVNYYYIVVDQRSESLDRAGNIVMRNRRLYIKSNDPTVQQEDLASNQGILLKDVFFNGKEIEISFSTTEAQFDNKTSYSIALRSLSEDLYKYIITSTLQKNTSGNPFAQPVNVYGNIKNGFGIFAGYSETVYTSDRTNRPIITSTNPTTARRGHSLTITGEHMLDTYVLFSAAQGTVHATSARNTRSTDTELTVTVPQAAVTGKFYVVIRNGLIGSSDFEIEVTD